MSWKITKRRNGMHMVTLAVKYHVTRPAVVDTIVAERWHEGTPAEDQNELTRAGVEHIVRDAYRTHGEDWDMTAGDRRYQLDDEDEAVAWAESELERLWPEWSDR